jgi:hypothetical protein
MKPNRQPRICNTCFLVAHGMDFFLLNDIFTLLPYHVFVTEDGHDDDGGNKVNPEQEFHCPGHTAAPNDSICNNRMEQDCRQNASICVIEDPRGKYRNQDDPQGEFPETILTGRLSGRQ